MQTKNKLDKESLVKIGKGALIAGGGAFLVYLLQAITQMDFGQFTLMIGAIAGILINSIKEFMKGQ